MRSIDRQRILQVRGDLVSLVRDGYPETAYCKLEEALGERGSWPIEPMVDLMRRIMALCPGEKGIELAVDAMCGITHFDERQSYWFKARFMQDLESAKKKPYVEGMVFKPREGCCDAARSLEGCYRIEDVPAPPIQQCDAEPHCCCSWSLIFDNQEPPSPWRKP